MIAPPFISCIMPTANRPQFVPHAVMCFLAQDFAARELLVIDNGSEPIERLLPEDDRIRYLHVGAGRKLGELRNLACELARGDVIAHWDDDDWYPFDRLSRQIARMLDTGSDVCGTSRIYFSDAAANKAWEYRSCSTRLWFGSSMIYRRSLWLGRRFEPIQVGEDTRFVDKVPRKKLIDMADPALCIATIHTGNTSPKLTRGQAWKSVDTSLLERLKQSNSVGAEKTTVPAETLCLPSHNAVHKLDRRICIGVYVRNDPARFDATLRSLAENTPEPFGLVILADGPDDDTCKAIARRSNVQVSATDVPAGAAVCFNRLLRENDADIYVFLESGSLVGHSWLVRLLAALDADPCHGLVGPSTNLSWNVQGEFRTRQATDRNVLLLAREAVTRFGDEWRSLAPLYCLADFCFIIRREVAQAIGGADEGYGLGPCWEMDYAVRAARAGFTAVWACSAYVFRYPFTALRRRNEDALFESNKKYYQSKFCGQMLNGTREAAAPHCRGDVCQHFAPAHAITLHLSLHQPAIASKPVRPPAIRSMLPLVTCIMPTHQRLKWVLQAIRYFHRQDYSRRELLIIDDGPESSQDFLPCDPHIRYVHCGKRMSIGAKRNLACELAKGDFIAHWDDDDWYGPSRLSTQLSPLISGEADISALTATLFFDLDKWQFWRCTPALFSKMFVHAVHGGTLTYKRQLFGAKTRFPNISLAEDAAFLRSTVLQGARLRAIDSGAHFVYVRHGHNAWRFRCGLDFDPQSWQRTSEPLTLDSDLAFYKLQCGQPH